MQALARTAALNDVKKMTVETFDGKLTSFVPLFIQYLLRSGKDLESWDFFMIDAVSINMLSVCRELK